MRQVLLGRFAPARFCGPAFVVCLLAGLAPARAADDRAQAVAALTDLKAAVGELVRADASYATDRNIYRRAAQRAINALAGAKGEGYSAAPGSPGDAEGAIGHIDTLLDRKETPVWADPLRGAEANLRAAIVHLHDSLKARELMDYQIAASRALAYIEVARGRPTETGVFGGLEGALANTALGVPAGATLADACAKPTTAPAYGLRDGQLAWVTTPASEGAHDLAENPGGTQIIVQGGILVLRTAAAAEVDAICAKATPKPAPSPQPTHAEAAPPALYTRAQAVAGAQVYAVKCVSCHGANLQGVAAPSVAGADFLTTAQNDKWTLSIIRYIVFNLMPRNSPASLPPAEGAQLMAYLLASNCYPAGATPFPSTEPPEFATIKLGPLPGRPPGQNDKGVCAVE